MSGLRWEASLEAGRPVRRLVSRRRDAAGLDQGRGDLDGKNWTNGGEGRSSGERVNTIC